MAAPFRASSRRPGLLTPSERRRLRTLLAAADDVRTYRRLLAVHELALGRSAADVAADLGVSRQSLSNWARAFRACGREPLADRPREGRPRLVAGEVGALLDAALATSPDRLGYRAVEW